MTKADKILIACIMVLAVGLVFPLLGHAPQSNQAVVSVKNKEVLRINLNQNANYSVNGKLGKDGKIRVRQENSPHHLCSKQGYVSDTNTPIVCLPNATVIKIEKQTSSQDTVIQ